jgi:5-carboxymethyl-2-hydroxymuconate isomerase
MPHLHLETTADLPENADIPDILEALCAELVLQSGADPARTRAFHTLRSVWYVGEGAPPAFVHLTVSVLSGKEEAWKRLASEGMLRVLLKHFRASVEAFETCVTVEIREMDAGSYVRHG